MGPQDRCPRMSRSSVQAPASAGVSRPRPAAARSGIKIADEGVFRDGQWIKGRRLNGDEHDQGLAWCFNSWGGAQIERCTVYHRE